MARSAYSYEKFMREKKKADKKKEREAKKAARLAGKQDDSSPGAPQGQGDGSTTEDGEGADDDTKSDDA